MQVEKRQIVGALLARRDHQRAIRADEQLPEIVDVELHRKLLEDLGLDPALLFRDMDSTSHRFQRRWPAGRRGLAGAGR